MSTSASFLHASGASSTFFCFPPSGTGEDSQCKLFSTRHRWVYLINSIQVMRFRVCVFLCVSLCLFLCMCVCIFIFVFRCSFRFSNVVFLYCVCVRLSEYTGTKTLCDSLCVCVCVYWIEVVHFLWESRSRGNVFGPNSCINRRSIFSFGYIILLCHILIG